MIIHIKLTYFSSVHAEDIVRLEIMDPCKEAKLIARVMDKDLDPAILIESPSHEIK